VTARRISFDIRQAAKPMLGILAAVLVLDLGFFLAFVRPQLADLQALDQANNPRFQALQKKQDEVGKLQTFVDGLGQARVDLKALRVDVLSTKDMRLVDVQAEIEDLCGRFDIDLDLVSYDHDRLVAEDLDVMRMEVPLVGGYSALRRFLQAVESSDRFLVVEQISLGKGKDGGVLLQMNITLATYFDAPGEGIAPRRGRGGRA
jgi:Tfp pilus assembly protein PilO